ncbi:MAG TPA: 3-deoxy-D-manno-octulosonic acid transferase [Blastocatellia bacterium]|nr:3-deoxy-D-manno-octulosonic acid transferase [Blastocatellia bacterium]
MYFLYSIFLSLAFLALLPYFLYQAFCNKKYLNNFRERLGALPEALRSDGRPTIWIHAVSVGETLAAHPLVQALRKRFPQHRLIFSTTTATGQAVARSRISEADGFCYYPFDWTFSVRKALNTIQPSAVVLMESELWPNFLRACKQRNIPVVVANGRVSDRSFRRSQKFAFWFRRMTANVTRFLMQSEADAARIQALGATPEQTLVSGNIKYDIGNTKDATTLDTKARLIEADFALSRAPLVVAGSSCDGEEELILAAFTELRKEWEDVRLLIAPRHPERFDAVAKLLDSSRFKTVRRSAFVQQVETVSAGGFTALLTTKNPAHNADIILLDSIGELASLYRFASVVFVGGSLVPKGGHNILEPALEAKPIIVGPHMENFREIATEFLRHDAVVQLQGANDSELIAALRAAWISLLTDKERAQCLGRNAHATVEANRGATAKTVAVIADLI